MEEIPEQIRNLINTLEMAGMDSHCSSLYLEISKELKSLGWYFVDDRWQKGKWIFIKEKKE